MVANKRCQWKSLLKTKSPKRKLDICLFVINLPNYFSYIKSVIHNWTPPPEMTEPKMTKYRTSEPRMTKSWMTELKTEQQKTQIWFNLENGTNIYIHIKTLCINQYRESRLSVLNGSPEFPHTFATFVTTRIKQCGDSQLSILNNTGGINSPR
jgi:hypothetical protein